MEATMTVRSKRRSRAAIRELVRRFQDEGLKPGTECPISGQWAELNANAPRAPQVEITAVQGKPLPATSRRGCRWVLVDATVHKAG
jgi:hypothetical protein